MTIDLRVSTPVGHLKRCFPKVKVAEVTAASLTNSGFNKQCPLKTKSIVSMVLKL
ncbi:hypothetical protein I8748_00915 [Nostoc sp. CENA67]|uniref:Uncharacterized protein n=1 Tax=Amazonocrinis nigriterrae CENA67 TaxID=2794033 RepID=A0A8J7HQN9_9NOST|nr:hypothetical protein [Amazonocrinis nigriterrae]MBH8560774.1 hypothetical protein [Amazonocrinis nigriterrae CENA67]